MQTKLQKLAKTIIIGTTIIASIYTQIHPTQANDGNLTITPKRTTTSTSNQAWFKFQSTPQSTIEDSVIIKNLGTEPKSIKIYPSDAYTNKNGSFILKQDSEPQNSIGAWTKLQHSNLILNAGEETEIPFKIYLPATISPGNYAGGIILTENNNTISTPCETNSPNACTPNITIQTRLATRIYLQIPGQMHSDITWTDFNIKKTKTNELSFGFEFVNKGNVAYEPRAIIEFQDFFGNPIEKIDRHLGESMPNSTTQPRTNYKPEKSFGIVNIKTQVYFEPKYTSNEQLKNAPESILKTTKILLFPWQLSLFLFLFFSTILLSIYYKTFKRQLLLKASSDYQVQDNDNLETLAKIHHINWKTLAAINKIKAPYSLKPGQTIKLPKQN